VLVGEVLAAITRSCMNRVGEKGCRYLVLDCGVFTVDEDLNQMREKFVNWQI
jgi:hypothetical protein